ncbi:type VI secretion system Vgr family protein [Paraburkholderia sp. J63]|uniref:type VI secretion system Vgr family protein n=1 Tax=Paraburkholderia sp. J63 TaxID=2805434 RepID=UPI002ABD68AD|nr:type VI secretion system tip protein TssI/VgrG [Paraburkholderia sp. J63]
MTAGNLRFSTLAIGGRAIPERVRIGPGGLRLREPTLIPRRVSGHEGIGRLFEYRVEAVMNPAALSMTWDAERVDLSRIRETEVTVTIDLESVRQTQPGRFGSITTVATGAGAREISGYVTEVSIVDTEDDTPVYEFVLRPWGWFASLGTNSRHFSGAIVDILHEVLSPYRGEIEWRLDGVADPRRDFIRQAWESDWDFCMRLCEEFGYLAWWEHRNGTHVLVIADNSHTWHRHSPAYETLRYHAGGGHINEEHITQLAYRNAVTLGKVTVHDHSYMSPRLNRSSLPYREEWAVPYDSEHQEYETYTRAEYAQPRTRPDVLQDDKSWQEDAQHLARVKLEAVSCMRVRANGSGHLRGIEAGKTFTLTHHPHEEANRDYLVLACTLDIREAGVMSSMLREYSVDASFDLHPASEPYRMPQVTPRPRIDGYEYAVIVGPNDAEIWLEAHNRVLIQYAWDRDGKFDGRSSIWVRVALLWQGNQMGTVVHGRCGQQVLVGYIDSDPDRPVVMAFVPDRDNMPPWKLPENQALSGMVTRSLGRGSTTNHLALDDTENRQQAQLASDHAKSSLSLGYITRIEGNAGRQDARGEGFELRTDAHGALRAALGLLITTVARPGARGKVKEMGETVARLTAARDIHEGLAQQAQRHGAQNAVGDQSDVTADMRRVNAELRGKPEAGRGEFPEFEAAHLVLSSEADIVTDARRNAHFASQVHTAITSGGHVSIATGKSFFASVREKVAFYAQKAITLVTPGRICVESRTADMRLLAQEVVEIISRGDWIKLASPKGIELHGGDSVLRISSEGIIGYTGGRFLVHAADHATDDPVSKPVDFPVTAENPGRLAAHHVLVEEGGGFAIANQPYRLTLDDGQVIEGVTNELGELQIVTSNAVSFGVVELMSQSAPEDVIAVARTAVYRDAVAPVPAQVADPVKRTTQVGGNTASTPAEGATTQGKPPAFLKCDPMNFGLRSSRYASKKRTTISAAIGYSTSVEYPVTRAYTLAIKEKLAAIDWMGLAGKPVDELNAVITPAVQEPLWTALQSGPFGLPTGLPDSLQKKGAMPSTKVIYKGDAKKYNMRPDVTASFISGDWLMAIYEQSIITICQYAIAKDAPFLSVTQGNFAKTIYHEARHCQQTFWMISLFNTYPEDYARYQNIGKYYRDVLSRAVYDLAAQTKFPNDERVRFGVHAMLMFHYYWQITEMQSKPFYSYLRSDFADVQQAVCDICHVTPEIAKQMADFDAGYYSQLHEEDAYATQEAVDSYWSNPDALFLREPGACTDKYTKTITKLGAQGNA